MPTLTWVFFPLSLVCTRASGFDSWRQVTLVPGAEEMVLDIYRNRSKSGKLNNQLGEGGALWCQLLSSVDFVRRVPDCCCAAGVVYTAVVLCEEEPRSADVPTRPGATVVNSAQRHGSKGAAHGSCLLSDEARAVVIVRSCSDRSLVKHAWWSCFVFSSLRVVFPGIIRSRFRR